METTFSTVPYFVLPVTWRGGLRPVCGGRAALRDALLPRRGV